MLKDPHYIENLFLIKNNSNVLVSILCFCYCLQKYFEIVLNQAIQSAVAVVTAKKKNVV